MPHTLESFATAAHDILAAENNAAGREKVRALLEDVLKDDVFVARHLTDDVPERKIIRKWRLQPGKMLLVDLEEGRHVITATIPGGASDRVEKAGIIIVGGRGR